MSLWNWCPENRFGLHHWGAWKHIPALNKGSWGTERWTSRCRCGDWRERW